jgi:outer membrane protein TolC
MTYGLSDKIRSRIESDLRNAFLDVQTASQMEGARQNIRSTRRLLKLTRQRLDAGISDTSAVVQSQDALAIVQSDYVNSVVALNVAKLAMARVIAAALKTGLDSWLSK